MTDQDLATIDESSLPIDPVEEEFGVVAVEAARELRARIPHMKDGVLVETCKALADRSGHGPVKRSVSGTVRLNLARELDRRRE